MGRKCRFWSAWAWSAAYRERPRSRATVSTSVRTASLPRTRKLTAVHRDCGEDLLNVPRLTRIFYKGEYFNYPLTPLNALFGVGICRVCRSCPATECAGEPRPGQPGPPEFRGLGGRPFGRRLFRTFFKTYTEKVWGIPCTQIGADWAQQRIKGLSLTTAVANAVFKSKKKDRQDPGRPFIYPRLGAGQLYEKMAANVRPAGGSSLVPASLGQPGQSAGFRC